MADSTPPREGLGPLFRLLRDRQFGLFWSAALVSNSGSFMQQLTVPFVIYGETHSAAWLGVAAFVGTIPSVVLAPVSGTLADRFERRQILVVTQAIQMAAALGLWALAVTGHTRPVAVIAVLFIAGCAGGLNIASWNAFVPMLVPRSDMLKAVRLNSMQFSGAKAIGPAVGAIVLARFGPSTVFATNAVTFLLVLGALRMVHPQEMERPTTRLPWRRQFGEGLSYTLSQQSLVIALLVIFTISGLGTAVLQLAPAIAHAQFRVGALSYGLLVTSYGVGGVLGALAIGAITGAVRRSRLVWVGMLAYAGAMFLLTSTTSYAVGVVSFGLMGFVYPAVAITLNIAIQDRVADQFRGRVLSVYLLSLQSGLPLGALILGKLGDSVGLRPTVAGAGVALVVALFVITLRYPGLSPLNDGRDDGRAAVATTLPILPPPEA